MAKTRAVWLETSEENNALDYLDKAYKYIQLAQSDVSEWKWVVLSLHGALYGFAICALQGTNYERVIRYTKKGMQRLIGFSEAINRCQDSEYMQMYVFSKELRLTESQKVSVRKLNDLLRNNFQHYIPKTWCIEVHGMPAIALDVLTAIRFLALETGNWVDLTPTQKRRVKSIVYQSGLLLKRSRLHKESLSANQIEC